MSRLDKGRARIATLSAISIAALVVALLPQVASAAEPAHPASADPQPTLRGVATGSDASCPAASSSAAVSGNVTAPTLVRAIPGARSATVVWCPPTSGAASVASYTVTSSGGQQVTATVPNDWAIVDGLTNGTAYTFTVVANTNGGTSSAARTRGVTPEPVAPPRHVLLGAPQKVTYDAHSLRIGGHRVFVTAVEFDPWRTPSPSLWLDRLQKVKAEGFNAVTAYFDWDYDSPSPGVYDFTGIRNINEFLNMAQQAGLYVIARPGPYINAETDGGGIPSWVLTSPHGYRNDNQPYLSAALQWLSQVDPIIAAHQITRGGDVIAYQVENEYYSNSSNSVAYMQVLEHQATADGIDVPLTGNHNGTFVNTAAALNIPGYDSYPLGFNCSDPSHFGNPFGYPHHSGVPLYLPEFQGGSFDGWSGAGYDNCYTMTGPAFENVYYKSNIADGITMQSDYMGVGGTNWGWLPDPSVYSSYDYGAAIRESGEIGTPADPNAIEGSKYGENKLINDFETSVSPLADTDPSAAPTADNPAIAATARTNPADGTQFIYLRQANASSTATVNTHLALNTVQSAGYTYDDANPALAYSGDWTHADASANYTGGDYDTTESWATQVGASVTLTFTGTAVQWIGPTNYNGGIADVAIDGAKVASVDTYGASGKQFQQVLFSKNGLTSGSHTLTITVTGDKDAASAADTIVVDALNVPSAAQQAGYFPVVPQAGSITLKGRDARMLVANYDFAGQHLIYSTSQIMTQATIGGRATAVLYDPKGTDGETVLSYGARPSVTVLSGSATDTWDAARGDLRLDYTHTGLVEVAVTGGGRSPLLLLITDSDTAQGFWPEQTSAGPVLLQGSYLVRGATTRGGTLALTGDTSMRGPLRVWAPRPIRAVTWNGRPLAVTHHGDGSLTGTVGGPRPVTLPTLTDWTFTAGDPETQPGFDDSSWTLADHPVSNASSPSTPVLYASDYGYNHGFVWYRGHFTATGDETGVTLRADGVGPTGAYSVWLNGAFLGSSSAAGSQTHTFGFPSGAVRAGKDNVVAVLVENTGNPEGPSGEKTGLYSASLTGSRAPITWRLMGNAGGTNLQDPVRGVMNAAGLYGSNHGWDLPGYPTQGWRQVSLPDNWSERGIPAGIGWYRTTFTLHQPRDGYTPVDVQIGGPGPGSGTANYRAMIYVNGWLIGRYVNDVGPQHQFYVPAGILNGDGDNTLAIAVWGLSQAGGGLANVSLVAAGNQAGGLPIEPVESPSWNAQVYGPPQPGQPTLAAVPSTTLATTAFTVTETLTNPGPQPLRDATLELDAPSGWTVTPAGAVAPRTVPRGGHATTTFAVTAPTTGLKPGEQSLLATATYAGASGDGVHTLVNTAQVDVPAPDLAATFNNAGVTDDSHTNPSPGFEGFDGEGTTFSAQGLAAAGLTPGATVLAGGLSFTWPDAQPAQPDNTMAQGQTITVAGSGSSFGFLTAANNAPLSGSGTIYYTDGTSQPFRLDVGNFWYPSGENGNPDNTQVAAVNYANYPSGSSGHTIYVFEQSVPLAKGKTVEAVTLPNLGSVAGYNAALHIFAMSLQ